MDTIHFSTETLICFGISGTFMILLALILFCIWRRRTHAPIIPVIVGAVIFPVFALVLKIPAAYPFLMADSELSRTINGNVWLSFVVAGVLAGVLEESGRFIAFRWILKHYETRRTAISYGIGHGGFECLYIGGTMLSFIVLGLLVNQGMLPEMTKDLPPEQLESAMAQLREYASQGIPETVVGILERAGAMALQIGLSVFVFSAVREKRLFWLFPTAVILHTWIDFSIAFFRSGMLPVMTFELLFLAQTAVILIIALRVVYPRLSAAGKEGRA